MEQNKLSTVILCLAIMLFIAAELRGLSHVEYSDENVYFYMSSLVAQGHVPYRDFFYAHPPVELILGAAIFKLFGFSIFILKLVPLLSTVATAVLIYLIAKNYFSEPEAILSALFYLSAYRVMLEATYFIGLNLAVMLMMLGFYLLPRRPWVAGIFFGIAAMTRLLVIIPILIMLGFFFLKSMRKSAKAIASFLAVFLGSTIFLASQFPEYYLSVFKFHLLKPAGANSLGAFGQFLSQNILLVAAFSLSFLFWNKRLIMFEAASIAVLLFLTQLNRAFSFYFLVAIPFMAIASGVTVSSLLKKANFQKYAVVAVATLFLGSFAFASWELHDKDFVDFAAGKDMAKFVKETSGKDDLIFGDVNAAPLVALLSERKIMGSTVDTNEMVYQSGVRSLESELQLVKESKIRFFIVRPLYGIGSLEETESFIADNCKLSRHFKDQLHGDFLVFDCS